ncbi:response regulator transcription factor [Agromyces kandeliae]|uniref:HTH luxR-type domain-containing protein n=1 Tax=Agromyces kandeliae TaxID=2666141 RepID=A0A6L5R2X5_9MICO|nr:helix-turn-helix transcriptional regulator [Agromyces kandeliae]MRX44391.1 hypothetical protein [Agromyces kandeliae]
MNLRADPDLDAIVTLIERHGTDRLPFLWRSESGWWFVEVVPSTGTQGLPGVRIRAHPTELPNGLTPAELDVLTQLIARDSDAEIARALTLSVRTVHSHVAHLRRKLGLGRAQAAARALVRGWYRPQGPGAAAMDAILALRT